MELSQLPVVIKCYYFPGILDFQQTFLFIKKKLQAVKTESQSVSYEVMIHENNTYIVYTSLYTGKFN